ncbi:hypothetical protein CDL15_Pgr020846 [Punica granatum]|uniref:GYF domain-containing protein n=1 Tax=Punica granatum TaxID=22663 RepID=A0A218XX78_PUNGR|nr:hypothetical protein CDL15_Pgr020846 [Punica granatum]
MDSPNPPGDQVPTSPNPPDDGGGGSAGGREANGESSAAVPDVPQQNPAEEDGSGHAQERDSDSRVADVAERDGGGAETKAARASSEKIRRKRGRASRASSDKAKSVANPARKREKKDEDDVCFVCFDGGELVVCDRRPIGRERLQSSAKLACYQMSVDKAIVSAAALLNFPEDMRKRLVQVDFDDKTSWEYLFKVYWTDLKEKLSLTVDEITRARKPRKERKSKSRRIIEKLPNGYAKLGSQQRSYLCERTGWASKELLEFVGYMKEGDTSALSRFEVQALLLEYVNRNNLRDPNQKWQISCDMRLVKLFGKASVDHFEMLKLLDSHFHVKENLQLDGTAQGTGIDAVGGQMDIDLNKDEQPVVDNDKKIENSGKSDEKDVHVDQDDFEGMDYQRIRSIYLRRNLIENLIDDLEQFQRKVVGSIVRIRVSGKDEKQEMHRLVQVVGTSKTSELYKFGDRSTNVKLEILNFDRKEVISIDEITDHDFSEEECRQFTQSIRCGQVKGFRKGENQQKALSVKAEQVIDCEFWMDSIVWWDLLGKYPSWHFGKVPLLPLYIHFNSQITQIPAALAKFGHPSSGPGTIFKPGLSQRGRSGLAGHVWESSYQLPVIVNKTSPDQGIEVSGINSWNTAKNHADAISSVTREALSGAASEISPSPLSTGTEQSVNDDETYKMWHYQDSNGKIQGPFTMVQMRKWRTVGQFPHDQRIWRNDEKQEDSILLTDALDGNFLKDAPSLHSREEERLASDDRDSNLDGVSSISVNTGNNSMRSELGSPFLSHTVKSERESIKKACRYFPRQFVGPSKTVLGPISGSQGFNSSNGISSHQQIGVAQTHGGSTGKREYDGDGYSSTQSSGQNWKAPSPVVCSSIDNPPGSLVNSLLATPQQSNGSEIAFSGLPGPAQKPVFENFRSPNNSVEDSGPSWSSASSLVNGASTIHRAVNGAWDSNLVPASSQKPTETYAIDGSTLTLGNGQLMPPSTVPPPFSWQAMVIEPAEFTSLPEESVSDLIAELEASEPLNTSFPSPSPKCSDGSRGGIRNDCFSPEASFFSVSQLGRVDSFSSSRNFPILSPSAVTNEPAGSFYFNSPQNLHKAISQENSSTMSHGYRNGYPEHGHVSWVSTGERNPEMWEKQQQQQQQISPYWGGNRSSNPRDQFFGGLNLDLSRGRSIWDRQ